jgi:LL-diaminopimelate aminotransferase
MQKESQTYKIAPAERLASVSEYYFSKKLKEVAQMNAEGKDVISLGIGSPDMPPSKVTIETLCNNAHDPNGHGYQPYVGIPELRKGFAAWYQRWYGVELNPNTEIQPLIGSKEGILHVTLAFVNPGEQVLVPNPGYPTYTSLSKILGAEVINYDLKEEDGWMPDFAEIERGGLDGVKIMIVNFPHMPTGAAPREGLFRDLVAFARKHNILLLHDNPYSFIRNEHPESLLATDGAKEVALELNSLSKSHSMAGWRIGMLAGAPERIDEVIRFKSNMDSGMFYPMQAAAAEALDLDEVYREREVKGFELLDLIGCSYAKPQSGLFVWGRLPEGAGDCFEFSDKLLYGCGVFITPGGIFGSEGNNYIRISLCSPVEVLERAKQRIREKM